ncbi:uncharacterized protein EV422DRAFT_593869, partial [Fimicolochytrium jonesii]|uniref:uncharacterized protein n=1 Tax=Fimicolochytrium jonesii TaxID=1396493 RepID=UPI0022FE0ABB
HPITSPHFHGHVTVRVKRAQETSSNPTIKSDGDAYFTGTRRMFSFQIQGQFAREWTGDEVMFGIELEKPIKLPFGADLAVGLAKVIDPGLEVALRGERPVALSPMLVTSQVRESSELLSSSGKPLTTSERRVSIASPLSSLLFLESEPPLKLPQKHFLPLPARQNFTFHPTKTYTFDFYNRYFDPSTSEICLPGFSIDASRYLNGQPLRFVARSRCGTATFFVIEFR